MSFPDAWFAALAGAPCCAVTDLLATFAGFVRVVTGLLTAVGPDWVWATLAVDARTKTRVAGIAVKVEMRM
jgi:hypothetical protein